jgi:hypothetical protein
MTSNTYVNSTTSLRLVFQDSSGQNITPTQVVVSLYAQKKDLSCWLPVEEFQNQSLPNLSVLQLNIPSQANKVIGEANMQRMIKINYKLNLGGTLYDFTDTFGYELLSLPTLDNESDNPLPPSPEFEVQLEHSHLDFYRDSRLNFIFSVPLAIDNPGFSVLLNDEIVNFSLNINRDVLVVELSAATLGENQLSIIGARSTLGQEIPRADFTFQVLNNPSIEADRVSYVYDHELLGTGTNVKDFLDALSELINDGLF